MPVSGTVLEVNSALESSPELINTDPFNTGWLIKIRVNDASQLDSLLDANQYGELINA